MTKSLRATPVLLLLFPFFWVLTAPQAEAKTHRREFRTLHNPVISADGAWMAAEELSDRGEGYVRVWSTQHDITFTIERGQNPRISRDSRWVSALQRPPLESSRTASRKNKSAVQTLVLLDLQDGSRRTFDSVLSYDVACASNYLIYVRSPETETDAKERSQVKATVPATKLAAKERRMGTLHLVHLESGTVSATIENVARHVTHETHVTDQTTDHFAYVVHDDETDHDTLYITALGRTGGWGYRGTYNGEKIEGLRWARDDITLGFLDSTETTGKDGKRRASSSLYTWHVSGPNVRGKFTRVAQTIRHDAVSGTLRNPVISADNTWMAAEERSHRGKGNVRVWSTQRDITFTIERGENPRFSRDSRWVSALQKPPLEDSGTAKPTNKRAGQTLILLDLQNGSRRTFDFVLSYDMTYASTYLLYLQSPETKADEEGPSIDDVTKPATKERKMGTLHQVPLHPDRLAQTGHQRPYETYSSKNVVEFATHPTSHHFAYVFHDEEIGRDTLRIVKWGIRAWYNGDKIEGLCWGRDPRFGDTADPPSDGITLGFLVDTETTDKNGKRRMNSALYTWQPDRTTSPPSPVRDFTRVDTPQ